MATTFKEALKVKCPLCGAEPGVGCVSVSGYRRGQKLSTLHNERLRAVPQESIGTR